MYHILIVKHGALGDVVRTSYFAQAISEKFSGELRLSWITAPVSKPLLQYNPYISDLWTLFSEAEEYVFDKIYSLDDEENIVNDVMRLKCKEIIGAVADNNGDLSYTEKSRPWFDMGLLSRFGKTEADRLKRENTLSHAQIFSGIFDVPVVVPSFYPQNLASVKESENKRTGARKIGINPFAGGRWKSKEMPPKELSLLVKMILSLEDEHLIYLLGAGDDRVRNEELAKKINSPRIIVPNTDDSIMTFASVVGELDYLITSDSLAMHLGVAQGIQFSAFFSPTSAAEIDDFGLGRKIISTAPDYCSYKKDADNSSITAERIFSVIAKHMPDLFRADVVC